MRNRLGFTAIEMALVSAIVGLLALFALPRLTQVRNDASLQGAKRHVITQLGAARASAVQRGRSVNLRTVGNEVYLTAQVSGVLAEISPRADLQETFGVSVTPSNDPVTFDARGFATGLPTSGAKFVLSRAGVKDSVCITRFGTIMPECGL